MERMLKAIVVVSAMVSLSACVTQNYEENDKPVVESDSSNSEIALTRISLGLGYLKMGNTTQAKFNLEKAKSFAPRSVEVYTAFAHYYETVGEDELTIQSYETALSFKPDDANTLNNYGVYLCRKERLEEAEKQFLRAISIPTYIRVSESYENLAICQLGALNFEKAELYLNKAIDHSPSNSSALYQMMRLQYAIGEYQAAKLFSKRYEKAARRFNAEFLALAYKIYAKLGEAKIASNYGAMLVKMHPQSWYAKQFILNGLESIEVDDLAEKYQILVESDKPATANKKVFVLSPTKKAPIVLSKNKPRTTSHNLSEKATATQAKRSVNSTSIKSEPESLPQTPQGTVTFSAPTEKHITSITPKAKGKRTVVLKAPKRADSNAIVAAVIAEPKPRTEMTVDEQLAALESITQETAELERESTDDLMEQISESSEKVDDQLDSEVLTDTGTGDEDLDAILAEAQALLEEGELEDSFINEEAQESLSNQNSDTKEAVVVSQVEQSVEHSELNELDIGAIEVTKVAEPDILESHDDEQATSSQIFQVQSEDLAAANVPESTTEILHDTLSDLTQDTATVTKRNLSNAEQSELVEVKDSQKELPVNIVQDKETSEVGEYQSIGDLPTHEIAENENLFSVSKRYNIRLSALRKWNNLDERSLLQIGDTLYLADPGLVVKGNK